MEIKKVEYKDAIDIKKLLVDSPSIVDTGKLLPEILEHIDKEGCVAYKIENDGKIAGVWLSKEYPECTTLSYFYIGSELRRKTIVLEFFSKCLIEINNNKPVLINSKDVTGFDKYVTKIAEDTYIFKGFR